MSGRQSSLRSHGRAGLRGCVAFAAMIVGIGLNAAEPLAAARGDGTENVRFEQRIGARLPLETPWRDTAGKTHVLGEFFHARPVVLYFGYAACPQLCAVAADETVTALRQIRPQVGREVEVVMLSIDPTEGVVAARERELDALRRYGDPAARAGWHYLRGSREAIAAVTAAAGFHFVYDPRSKQYAHPSGFVVVTPGGVVSRYFLGVDFQPVEVASAIKRAGAGKTGAPAANFLLRCFRGDGIAGRYGGLIWRVLMVAVSVTVLLLAGGVGWMLYEERRARRATEASS